MYQRTFWIIFKANISHLLRDAGDTISYNFQQKYLEHKWVLAFYKLNDKIDNRRLTDVTSLF